MTSLTPGRLHLALAAACPIDGVSIQSTGSATFHPSAVATAAQIAAAQAALASFDWSDTADQTWWKQQQQAGATGNLGTSSGGLDSAEYVTMRAIVEVLVDQLNAIRAALVPPLAAITLAQAKSAIQSKINAGSADS